MPPAERFKEIEARLRALPDPPYNWKIDDQLDDGAREYWARAVHVGPASFLVADNAPKNGQLGVTSETIALDRELIEAARASAAFFQQAPFDIAWLLEQLRHAAG